eukprot:SAG11_NODE_25631_length_356_cov_0.805447_1_plen_58_part_10
MDRGAALHSESASRSYSGPVEVLPGLDHPDFHFILKYGTLPTIAAAKVNETTALTQSR